MSYFLSEIILNKNIFNIEFLDTKNYEKNHHQSTSECTLFELDQERNRQRF